MGRAGLKWTTPTSEQIKIVSVIRGDGRSSVAEGTLASHQGAWGGHDEHGGSYQRPGRSWKVTSGPDFFEKMLSNDGKSELFAKFWHLPFDSRDETCIERKPGPDFSIETSFRMSVACLVQKLSRFQKNSNFLDSLKSLSRKCGSAVCFEKPAVSTTGNAPEGPKTPYMPLRSSL